MRCVSFDVRYAFACYRFFLWAAVCVCQKNDAPEEGKVECWGAHIETEFDTVLFFKNAPVTDISTDKKEVAALLLLFFCSLLMLLGPHVCYFGFCFCSQMCEINTKPKTIKKINEDANIEGYLKAEEEGTVAEWWKQHFEGRTIDANVFIHVNKEKGKTSFTAHVENEDE